MSISRSGMKSAGGRGGESASGEGVGVGGENVNGGRGEEGFLSWSGMVRDTIERAGEGENCGDRKQTDGGWMR